MNGYDHYVLRVRSKCGGFWDPWGVEYGFFHALDKAAELRKSLGRPVRMFGASYAEWGEQLLHEWQPEGEK